MKENPDQVKRGKQFLKDLFDHIVVPAFGSNGKVKTQGTLLQWAAMSGHAESFKNADIEALKVSNDEAPTLFELALQYRHPEVAYQILERGVIPNDEFLSQAVQLAAATGHLPLVEKIIDICEGASKRALSNVVIQPNATDSNPLFIAHKNNQNLVADRLILAGADPKLIPEYKASETRYQECRSLLQRVEAELNDRKKPILPRNKLKHELVEAVLDKLYELNEGTEKGRLTAQELFTKRIRVSQLNLSQKAKTEFKEYLKLKRDGEVQGPDAEASLQDVLAFQRNPKLDHSRGAEKTKSSQQIAREFDPVTMRKEATDFLQDVITRLEKKKDFATTREKKEVLKQRREAKIADLKQLKAGITGNVNIRTVKNLCEYKVGDNTLLDVLNRHQDPAKEGKRETKSYQEFCEKFRVDKRQGLGAATVKARQDVSDLGNLGQGRNKPSSKP